MEYGVLNFCQRVNALSVPLTEYIVCSDSFNFAEKHNSQES